MKIKSGFIMNKIGTQYVVVPVGETSVERHCMIRLNETGAFLWKHLQTSSTEKHLVDALQSEYDVSAQAAERDVETFLAALRKADLLDE